MQKVAKEREDRTEQSDEEERFLSVMESNPIIIRTNNNNYKCMIILIKKYSSIHP